jgi:uncharacterized protein YndB with AHSA1/START domain
MSSAQATTEAIRKTVTIECTVEHAFRTFTEGIGTWWPLHTHSISVMEDGSEPSEIAVMEPRVGGRLYERTRDGRECDWGSVLAWEPPDRVVLEWRVNPDRPPTEVEVRFTPDGAATQVDLEHRGWERYPPDVGPQARASYAGPDGWEIVFGAYAAKAGS